MAIAIGISLANRGGENKERERLAINDFFTEEVENLTIEADKTKNELNTLTKANEMKKAYGS